MVFLLRLEYWEGETSLQAVAVEDVISLPLKHGQHSNLAIFERGKRVGTLVLRPSEASPEGWPGFSVHGNLRLRQAGDHRLSWNMTFSLDSEMEVRDVDLRFSYNHPAFGFELRAIPSEDKITYRLVNGMAADDDSDFAGGIELTPQDLEGFGLTLPPLNELRTQWELSQLKAYRVFYSIGEHRISAFKLVSDLGGGMKIELYMDQIGQILEVDTFLGYRLLSEDLEF